MFIATKPEMSDAQYRTAQQVIERQGAAAIRFRDCSVSTLIAMSTPRRRWAEIRYDWDGNRRYISHAELTGAGRKVFDRETARRAAAIEHERKIAATAMLTPQGPASTPEATATARSIIAAADPFRVVATGRPTREVHPDSPYGDDIPF